MVEAMDTTSVKLHRAKLDGNQKLNLFELSSQREAQFDPGSRFEWNKGKGKRGRV
jgi:hypothetical protein